MSWRDYSFRYFQPSRPREAKGGIKAQSKQGQFGASWWAKRWLAVLESFDIGARLQRGRSYARRGQVLDIHIETGRVKAKVQGSRPQPYAVEIKVKTLSKAEGDKLGKALSRQAIFAAKLLAGEMPQDIEQAFADAGLSLFPQKLDDLDTDCSCPDWSNPCKHIAAVYYLVGEEFDRDPFLIFKLRGVDREKLVALLGEEAGETATKRPKQGASEETEPPALAPEPLNPTSPNFWQAGDLPAGWLGEVRPPPLTAALPKRLGNFPFWRANERFLDALTPLYTQASARGVHVLLGERE
ncbi:MAG: SWIM zinc finger family protein [Verrucomicrobia bacterium]|nr:SWIM zinc finger family protein [Verrucomicrobiota bacterium]